MVDAGAGDIIVGTRQVLAGRVRDHGDDGGVGATDADETADGRPYLRDGHPACGQKSHPGEGSAHRNHTSERCHGNGTWHLMNGRRSLCRSWLDKRLSLDSSRSFKSGEFCLGFSLSNGACVRRGRFALNIEGFRSLAHPPSPLTPGLPTAERGLGPRTPRVGTGGAGQRRCEAVNL